LLQSNDSPINHSRFGGLSEKVGQVEEHPERMQIVTG
jgi:hypothetical protein